MQFHTASLPRDSLITSWVMGGDAGRSDWHLVYDFSENVDRVRAIRERSLEIGVQGLRPVPHPVGSTAWWDLVKDGSKLVVKNEGTISKIWWGSMADWPEFAMRPAHGQESSWTREGDPRRFVVGLRARIEFVEERWKKADRNLGPVHRLVLRMWTEESRLRSSGIAPGPGGVGTRIAGGQGTRIVYLDVPSMEVAEVLRQIAWQEGRASSRWRLCGGRWMVQVAIPGEGEPRREQLLKHLYREAERLGGRIDGSEEIE